METLKMVLANGKEIEISEVNFPLHIIVVRNTKEDVFAVWNEFTTDSLKRVEFRQGDDVLFAFTNCKVRGNQIVVNADGTITGHYYFDGDRETVGEEIVNILMGVQGGSV